MSASSAVGGCCAAAVQRQKEFMLQQRCPESASLTPDPTLNKTSRKLCTVVENGRVVVRPINASEEAQTQN